MPSVNDILKKLLGGVEEVKASLIKELTYIFPNGFIINRDIEDFKGSILDMGGTHDELLRYKNRFGLSRPEDKIYTVNIDLDSKADLIADMGSKNAMRELPDNRFDVVVFSGVPSAGIDLNSAFKTAARVLKEDGILIFKGQSDFYSTIESRIERPGIVNIKNPVIKLAEKDHYKIDIPRLLAGAGFKQGKPLKDTEKYEGGLRLGKIEGGGWIASKSTEPINLFEFYERCPGLREIVAGETQEDPAKVAGEMPSYGSDLSSHEGEDQEGPSFKP